MKRKPVPETIAHFLARGGEIEMVPRGASAYDTKKRSRHIIIKSERHNDPRASRRKDNEKFYK